MNATEEAFGGVSIILGFLSNKTEPIPALSSAADVQETLSLLEGVGDIEVFVTHEQWGLTDEGQSGLAISWNVRFYPPAHVGAQPPITAEMAATSGGSRRRTQLASLIGLAVQDVSNGASPLDDAITLGVLEPVALDPTESSNTTITLVEIVPFVHVCGDGKRSSAELCDDNNTEPLDGCDALCQIEVGWACAAEGCAELGSERC